MILAMEQLNSQRIQLLHSKAMADGVRLQRIQNEVRGLQIRAVWHHLAVRLNSQHIPVRAACRNLPAEKELALARRGSTKQRTVVYTCVTGTYDRPVRPFYRFDHCDYVLFSEHPADGWSWQKIPEKLQKMKHPAWINRYLKLHPFQFFADQYDYAVYIDGNITPVSDLSVLAELVNPKTGLAFHRHCSRSSLSGEVTACKNLKKGNLRYLRRQIRKYKSEGMPDNYGLAEGNVIVTDLKNHTAKKLMDMCWHEFAAHNGGRDQIVWPYVLWKSGICMEEVCTLGNNVWMNPKLYITEHARNRQSDRK